MIRLEEFQVKCYERKYPERSVTEVAQELEDKVNGTDVDKEEVADSLRDMLVYVAKFADKIGYTLGEVAER